MISSLDIFKLLDRYFTGLDDNNPDPEAEQELRRIRHQFNPIKPVQIINEELQFRNRTFYLDTTASEYASIEADRQDDSGILLDSPMLYAVKLPGDNWRVYSVSARESLVYDAIPADRNTEEEFLRKIKRKAVDND